jgi:leucyl aminopeptidase
MPSAQASRSPGCTAGPLSAIDTDLLIVPWFQDEAASAVAGLDAAAGGEVARALSSKEFQGKPFDLFYASVVDRSWNARRVALVGAGAGERGTELLRKLATAAGLSARAKRVARAAFLVRGQGDPAALAQAVTEGLTLSEFYAGSYKTGDPPPAAPPVWTIAFAEADDRALGAASEAVSRGRILGDSSNLARELANEPGNTLTPREFARRAAAIASDAGVSVEILDEGQIEQLNMGLLLGVARGSSEPPRVIGVVPTTENMPGGRAIKPGDILRSAAGKTVEVINTDAEGRLILGDGLWYARRLGATHLVDVATLTGAVVVALGKITSGLFGNNDAWIETVRRVADRAGDRVWPMPLFDEYREQIKSEIADMMNTGGRAAGSITAAMFLKEFADGLPWVHMDIAGTAWAEESKPYLPKGPSGVAVRTLAALAFESF